MAKDPTKYQTSDYDKTQRKLNPDGTITYVKGGSRLGIIDRDDVVRKVGTIVR